MLSRMRPAYSACFILASLAGFSAGCPPQALGDNHPRLMINADELQRIRHVCGVGVPGDSKKFGGFGALAREYLLLRNHFLDRTGDPLPGEVLAAAFLQVVDPHQAGTAQRLALIESALQQSYLIATDGLELALALDWCWDDVDPGQRSGYLARIREHARLLEDGVTPLTDRHFRDALHTLAIAVAIDSVDDPTPEWRDLRAKYLADARDYFATIFPRYLAARGRSPTTPAAAAEEEFLTAFAIELASHLEGVDAWATLGPRVERWLEHYLYAQRDDTAQRHFLRDDFGSASLSPCPVWSGMYPLTAHLIAARTRNPAAAVIADQIMRRARRGQEEMPALPWRWVPILYDLRDVPRCDPKNLPIARCFDGAVAFRGNATQPSAVWIETAQPFLRRGQHFDAGHFLINADGFLAVGGGAPVASAAVKERGGEQRLGDDRGEFEFEQYFTSSISHNCLLFWDASLVQQWYGKRFEPVSGQRPIEYTCSSFQTPLESQQRITGKLLAYGHQGDAAYVALDLRPAYEPRAAAAYTREFIWLWGRALLVIDRVQTKGRVTPTWIVNIPSRPTVDGRDLNEFPRMLGATTDAGAWQIERAAWLRWVHRDSALWHMPLSPSPSLLHAVGGPMTPLQVGAEKGEFYFGSSPGGFEHLVIPSTRYRPKNAWYRLGPDSVAPPLQAPHWGRIEIEPSSAIAEVLFINLFIIDSATNREPPPPPEIENDSDSDIVHISLGSNRATLRIGKTSSDKAAMNMIGGELEWSTTSGSERLRWVLPATVQPDAPLAIRERDISHTDTPDK